MTPGAAALLRHLQRLIPPPTALTTPDSALLQRFAATKDDAAFEAIVSRHGPMVLRVCRRTLADLHAVEDAFQATFLMLARRARSIRRPASLAAWLHGVAHRVALKIHTAEAPHQQRGSRESAAARSDARSDLLAELTARELLAAVDEEVSRLPEIYRLPVILCCLEGQTREEASRQLGWTPGSVKGRLQRGRAKLHAGLVKRGLTLTAALAAAQVSPCAVAACVPAALTVATTKAAVAFAAGTTAVGSGMSAKAAALADAGLKAMTLTKMKIGAVLLLATGMAAAGAIALQIVPAEQSAATRAGRLPALNVDDGPRLLDKRSPPGTDRYGDPLPPNAIARLGTLRFRRVGGGGQAVVVPGGKQLLGLGESTIVLWDATTGKEVRHFDGPRKENGVLSHNVHFESMAVSPDGKTLAAATSDSGFLGLNCPLLLFDVATGRKLAEWPGHPSHGYSDYPLVTFVSPTLLVSGDHEASVRVWDVTAQRELRRLVLPAGSHVSAIVASPDRQHVFVAGWDAKEAAFWTAWEAATGRLVHHEKNLPGAFVKLALAPDGPSLGLAMGIGRQPKEPDCTEMRLYAGPGWKERRRWRSHDGDDGGRCSIVFSPDGKTIATGGADGKVRRWDTVTGNEIGPLIDPGQKHCQNVAYLDAATLVTFGFTQTFKFWDATTGKSKLAFAGSDTGVAALAYSPDGRHVAVGSADATIRVWEPASGNEVALLRDNMSVAISLHFTPDGRKVVAVDSQGVVRLWDWAEGGAPVKTFSDHKSWLDCVAVSSDGKSIATGEQEAGTTHVRSLVTGKLIHALKGHMPPVFALAFSRDGQALFSASCDSLIRRWDVATGTQVRVFNQNSLGHTSAVGALAVSPGGRWVYSGGYDGSVCVWEASSGRLGRVLKDKKPGYNSPITIALSHDGTQLAAALKNDWEDRSVHLWDLTTGQKALALSGHRSPVSELAFSPDGRRLTSGSYDTTALVWDVSRLRTANKTPDVKALAALWDDLGADDPKVAYAAVCRGAAAGDAAVARLRFHIKPAVTIDAAKVAAWVHQLNADKFAVREKAGEALIRLGPDAAALLRDALEKAQSAEVKGRLGRILDGQEAEYRRPGDTIEVLEMIATPAARRLLADLAKGPSACRLTRDARAALDRLRKRS